MDLQNLTGKMLTDSIRQKAQVLLVIFLSLTVLALLTGILLVIRLRITGAQQQRRYFLSERTADRHGSISAGYRTA